MAHGKSYASEVQNCINLLRFLVKTMFESSPRVLYYSPGDKEGRPENPDDIKPQHTKEYAEFLYNVVVVKSHSCENVTRDVAKMVAKRFADAKLKQLKMKILEYTTEREFSTVCPMDGDSEEWQLCQVFLRLPDFVSAARSLDHPKHSANSPPAAAPPPVKTDP